MIATSQKISPDKRNLKRPKISAHKLSLVPIVAFIVISAGMTGSVFAAAGGAQEMKTVSGHFLWSVDTLGARGSTLYDCCVVNDSLAYAVGWIMPVDSSARSHTLDWYNAAVWNGVKWTLFQVPVYFNGRKTFSPIHCVYASNKNDVWFGMYYMVHWNGRSYSQVFPRITSFENKIWESADRSELYAVGDYGMISYSPDNGKDWEVVHTGTGLPFRDIWGAGGQVLAVASGGDGHTYIAQLKGNVAKQLPATLPFERSVSGIWFAPGLRYFIVGNGIFENIRLNREVWRFDPFIWDVNRYQFAVRGTSPDNVFTAGLSGTLSHWNGKKWSLFPRIGAEADRLHALSVKGNVVIAVGQRFYDNVDSRGVIYTGVRRSGARRSSASRAEWEERIASFK